MSSTTNADRLASFRRRLLGALVTSGALGVAGCAAYVGTSNPDAGDSASPATDATVLDATTPPDASAPFQCSAGSMGRRCFTRAEVEAYIASGGGSGDVPRPPDAGPPDVTVGPNGCVIGTQVRSSCCNPAANVEVEGDRCCYTWCDMACCGRPLVIDGGARLADARPRADWLHETQGAPLAHPDEATRAALAAAWLDDALMEHASVGSFARFTLELLAVGAPAELVAASQRAGLDEVDHARRCFALAARYTDTAPVGPGPLPVDGLVVRADLAEVAAAAVREGCVGETLSALYAEAQAANARDADTRASLEVIARDEGAHAELAWRFVSWALGRGDARVRGAVERAFSEALCTASARPEALPVPRGPGAGVDETAWKSAGRLGTTEAAALARGALAGVLEPCARALLAGVERTAAGDPAQGRPTSRCSA